MNACLLSAVAVCGGFLLQWDCPVPSSLPAEQRVILPEPQDKPLMDALPLRIPPMQREHHRNRHPLTVPLRHCLTMPERGKHQQDRSAALARTRGYR
jgi:hypothetical protein